MPTSLFAAAAGDALLCACVCVRFVCAHLVCTCPDRPPGQSERARRTVTPEPGVKSCVFINCLRLGGVSCVEVRPDRKRVVSRSDCLHSARLPQPGWLLLLWVCVYLHKYLLASIRLELVVPLVLDRLRFSQPKFNTQLKEPYFSARARESSFMRTANSDQRLSFATKPLTQNNETLCPPPWSSPSEPPSRCVALAERFQSRTPKGMYEHIFRAFGRLRSYGLYISYGSRRWQS